MKINQIRHIDFKHFDTGQNTSGVAGQGRKFFPHTIELLGGFLQQLNFGVDFIDIDAFESIHINIDKPSPLLYIGGGLGFLAVIAFLLEMVFIVKASLAAKEGELFEYPLTINFLK